MEQNSESILRLFKNNYEEMMWRITKAFGEHDCPGDAKGWWIIIYPDGKVSMECNRCCD